MKTYGYTLFDTPIGSCGIAWGGRGIVCLQLPESSEAETRERLTRRVPEAVARQPPADVADAIAAIGALLTGRDSDLSNVRLDMGRVPPFHRRVYEIARAIPPGETLSYGAVAERMGAKGAARAVGQALGRNPFAIIVPCHRVLAAGGKLGGFSAKGGLAMKIRMLALEGVTPGAGKPPPKLFDGDGQFGYDPRLAIEHLRACDPKLARLIDTVGPFRMELHKTSNIFTALARAIVFQQLNGKAAATIFQRLCALFPGGKRVLKAEHILGASDETLRGAGISRPKMLALRDLARRAAEGEIPTLAEINRMENEAIIERLTQVRGIGRWTVEMILMFRLGRPDVLPVDDYGVRKGFSVAFATGDAPTPKALAEYGAKWAPYRSVASWYLWRAADMTAL
jgi:methylated-DNA-[protein]-cysteine S-methyltransferase